MSRLKEDQGAPVTARALGGTGVHHHHLKGGSIVLHLIRAHKREVARPKGMADRPMGLITVGVLGERAEALWMMLMKRPHRSGAMEALPKKMARVAALVLAVGMIGALLRMTIIMVLQEAASQTEGIVKRRNTT